jgi:hypothetical protein
LNATRVAREIVDKLGFGLFIGDCLAAPEKEPRYDNNTIALMALKEKQP